MPDVVMPVAKNIEFTRNNAKRCVLLPVTTLVETLCFIACYDACYDEEQFTNHMEA